MMDGCAREAWTFDAVEEALVDCMTLWRRSPGGGRWPFAGDAPWHLIQLEWGDHGAHDETHLRPLPLSRSEVRRRDAVSEWLRLIDNLEGRRLLVFVVAWKAGRSERVPWARFGRRLGINRSADTIAWRYRMAISQIACGLNGQPQRFARQMAARTGGQERVERGIRTIS